MVSTGNRQLNILLGMADMKSALYNNVNFQYVNPTVTHKTQFANKRH